MISQLVEGDPIMMHENDQWDRYVLRYGGYRLDTLEDFVDRGIATYDRDSDTYTVRCDHWGHDPASCSGTFTVGLSPEFA
jgi:hypothetical protein